MEALVCHTMIPIKEGARRCRVQDTFGIHQTVVLVQRTCRELVVFGVPRNTVRLSDAGGPGNVNRSLEIVERVLSHGVSVEDVTPLEAERKATHLAHGVAFRCQVPVVFGTPRTEFDDVVAIVQFVGEGAQEFAQRWMNRGIGRTYGEDDRVCVEVEDAVGKLIQCFVESEMGPAGGKTGHEDIWSREPTGLILPHLETGLNINNYNMDS